MDRKSFTLMEIMVVVAVIIIIAAMSIPNLLRSRLSANQAAAKTTLKVLSTAYEAYCSDSGSYKISTSDLNTINPQYINEDYADGNEYYGHTFTCAYDTGYYTCLAYCSMSGDGETFSIATGGMASW